MRRVPSAQHAEYDGGKADRRRRIALGQRRVTGPPTGIPGLTVGEPIGRGNFSSVFLGTYNGVPVAIKAIQSGSDEVIDTEIEILRELKGCANVVQLLDVVLEPEYVLIFEYVDHLTKEMLFSELNISNVRMILKCTLQAIVQAHAHGIVHRDIKLANVMVDPQFQRAVLGDWGCGAWISDSLKAKAGSRSCRPPEQLFGSRTYGAGCDVWAFGILALTFLSGGWIPWKKSTAPATLAAMSEYFGGQNLIAVAKKYGLRVPDLSTERLWSDGVRKRFDVLYYEPAAALRDPALVDLMKTCLCLDPEQRPTAADALAHRFFAQE